MINTKFIHYGTNEFDPKLFKPIKNINFCKPSGGLWASPEDSPFGWEDWCIREDYNPDSLKKYFTFILSPECKIYKIESYEDLIKLPLYNKSRHLDFEEISKSYGAIWLTECGEVRTHFTNPSLYGWDCDSILIFKPEYIITHEKNSNI